MSKPINFNDKNCESKSSNCIIWDGPKIDCINLCNGDNVTKAIYNLATELCTIMDQLDITNYDLTCLNITTGAPSDFTAFINILIQKVCDVNSQGGSQLRTTSSAQTDTIVNLAPCFQYNDPSNGNLVITSTISDYVQRIGIVICSNLQQITALQNAVSSVSNRVTALENNKPVPYVLPNIAPTCIGDPTVPIALDQFAKVLEQMFCQLSQSIGSANNVYRAITSQPADFNNARALGTGGGTMGSKAGWSVDPVNLTDSFVNVWLTISDLRSAITNIQQNCCNTLCDGIELVFNATLEAKILKLFFTGTIPSNLQSCLPNGALFTITDYSGNSVNISVDIKNNLNNASGYSADLTSTPLNFADDLKITTLFCFNDPTTGSVCQNFLETIVSNNLNCPALTVSPSITSVAYEFAHNSGTLTYSVQLFDSTNVMVQSQNISASTPVIISNIFSSLNQNTNYKIRLQLITANSTKTCPFVPFTTLSNPCPPVLTASAVINIV